MTVTIEIPKEMERKLREEAARAGQDLSGYIQQVLATQVGGQQGARNSIMELHGIGKATWQDVDVAAYIATERDSWGDPV